MIMKRAIFIGILVGMVSTQAVIAQEVFVSSRYTTNGGETYTLQTTEILVHPKEQNVTFTQDSFIHTYFINSKSEIQITETTNGVIQTITLYCEDKSGRKYNILFSLGFHDGRRDPIYSVVLVNVNNREKIIYF
jgi:hypothetical protein